MPLIVLIGCQNAGESTFMKVLCFAKNGWKESRFNILQSFQEMMAYQIEEKSKKSDTFNYWCFIMAVC